MIRQLLISVDRQLVKRTRLDKTHYLVGRSADCDITLLDRMVSQRHARIYQHDFLYFIEDLDSTNGTYVNQKLVQHHELQDGDYIRMGRHIALFREVIQRQKRSI